MINLFQLAYYLIYPFILSSVYHLFLYLNSLDIPIILYNYCIYRSWSFYHLLTHIKDGSMGFTGIVVLNRSASPIVRIFDSCLKFFHICGVILYNWYVLLCGTVVFSTLRFNLRKKPRLNFNITEPWSDIPDM